VKVLLGTILNDSSDKILLYLLEWLYLKTYRVIKFYDRSLQGIRHCVWFIVLRPPACWDGGFESRRWHECLPLVGVVCRKVDVCAPGWSLFHRGSTECDLCECDHKVSILRRLWHAKCYWAMGKGKKNRLWSIVNMTVYSGTWFSNVSCEPPCSGTRMHTQQVVWHLHRKVTDWHARKCRHALRIKR